jgi:indole-3-glycerol phosphate synthase
MIGADAILLIAAILEPDEIRRLFTLAADMGLEVLLEVHSKEEIDNVAAVNPNIIGINNRDLTTFTVDLATTEKLRTYLPDNIVCISESGIRRRDDMVRMQDCGVDAVLVGEGIVTSRQPAGKIRELLGKQNDTH